ncbi:MAG: type III-B CRISPR-associated protein Cas10/Cmr2 [Longimonas sp.]|uniref:type III-B CRISPR-associated protein Cas10/Cmr2 n=1 Tax=Longimonas sp. TaxID=2039626 RepID=UPI0033469D3F
MPVPNLFQRKLSSFLSYPVDAPFREDYDFNALKERATALQKRLRLDTSGFSPEAQAIASANADALVPDDVPSVSLLKNPEIRHPFSGEQLPWDAERRPADLDEVERAVNAAFDNLNLPPIDASEVPGQHTFLSLWRNLIPTLRAHSPEHWAALWDVLPANPVFPDHSLAQHLRMTSAFSGVSYSEGGFTTDSSFVLFTIGPVQRFIKQARKTKDLYWSSYLLSYLCWIPLQRVVSTFGPDAVIFPDLHGQPLVDHWMENELGLNVRNSQAAYRDLPTLPNRFFAVIEAESDEALRSFMEKLEDDVQQAWMSIGEAIFSKPPFNRIAPPASFNNHLSGAISTYWAGFRLQKEAAPITPDGLVDDLSSYVTPDLVETVRARLNSPMLKQTDRKASLGHVYDLLYTLTEKRLGAQKTTRPFAQLGGGDGERGRKGSLSGERNVLFYRGHPAQIRHNKHAVDLSDYVSPVDLRDGEGLSGVGFTKRFADRAIGSSRSKQFDATADVATQPMRRADAASVQRCETAMKNEIGGKRFDGQLLYEENLTVNYLASYVYPEKDAEHDRAELEAKADALRRIHNDTLSEAALGAQSSYYAIIALDGDSIGNWLAGENGAPSIDKIYHSDVWDSLDEDVKHAIESSVRVSTSNGSKARRPLTPALHATISQAMAQYALHAVRPIVEDYDGFLVYAGGDDVLAFVSLDTVLDVLIELRAAFSGHRTPDGTVDLSQSPSGFVEDETRLFTTLGPGATASAGVAIAHYKAPLSMVLDTAYTMEKEHAKKYGDGLKDAVALAVLKRSGERNQTVLPFQSHDNAAGGTLMVLRDLVADLQAHDISPTFMRTLRKELYPLADGQGTLDDFPQSDEFLRAELKRLILRKANATPDWTTETADQLTRIYTNDRGDLGNFLAALDILLFLNKETTSHASLNHAA